ncbi:MAG: MmcQ/YjbR family DNA-binding protein [Phenylobacterium sp.]|uniref:MmcQ/YjbR family DNA-binding protein n=1 Tax=Phenylobacterium sp. TaxID=1871053 RepID=UPI003BB4C4C3
MTPAALEACALSFPAATKVVQWGGSDVYKVGGKIFAIVGLGGRLMFMVTDLAYEVMTESGMAKPAPYLARAKWVSFDELEGLDPDEVADWLKTAHGLIAAKLTRAQKAALGL